MYKILKAILIFNFSLLLINSVNAQFAHQDTLRGSNGPGRDWWDVKRYELRFSVDYNAKKIQGDNKIEFAILKPGKEKKMQVDLQEPMQIDAIFDEDNKKIEFKREGNVFWINFDKKDFKSNKNYFVRVHFEGIPRVAQRPPWDGGWIFTKDMKGRPWMSVACQGL